MDPNFATTGFSRYDSGVMKTTVDIPDGDLADAMRFTRAKTQREAIVAAIQDLNMETRKSTVIRDRRLVLGEALINFAHPAHHVGSDGRAKDFSRADGALAVAARAALISRQLEAKATAI